jgi:hypothetical protein
MVGPSQECGNPEPSLRFLQNYTVPRTVLVDFGLASGIKVHQKTDDASLTYLRPMAGISSRGETGNVRVPVPPKQKIGGSHAPPNEKTIWELWSDKAQSSSCRCYQHR